MGHSLNMGLATLGTNGPLGSALMAVQRGTGMRIPTQNLGSQRTLLFARRAGVAPNVVTLRAAFTAQTRLPNAPARQTNAKDATLTTIDSTSTPALPARRSRLVVVRSAA